LPEDHPPANQEALRVPMLGIESLIIYAVHGGRRGGVSIRRRTAGSIVPAAIPAIFLADVQRGLVKI
jgi:hypothetical protein